MEPAETQSESPKNSQELTNAAAKSSKEGSEIAAIETASENGARVSLNGKGDKDIDIGDLNSSVVGTQVPAEAMGGRIDVNLSGNDGVLEDPDMNGASSLLKMQESKNSQGLVTALDENEKREIDNSNGVSLVADLCGEVNFREGVNDLNLQCEPLDENEMEEEVNSEDEKHDFTVGDFVWGKIRSHPWWPGRVYDPLDASDYAKKVKLGGNKLLVAYFGDGTFAWCHPSQLKPLDDNFAEMSTQSSSKNFVNALENAMDEIGRLVDLKMTCSCVPKDNLIGFGRTLAVNAGIKEGLLIPEGGIDKFSSVLFEPVELLTELKDAAQDATATSLLEFTVLKSWLSAFYRAKGGHQLPSYYDPMPVPGLEDKSRDWTDEIGDHNGGIQGPEEEYWISSPRGRKYGQTSQSQPHKSQRGGRKQKSLAEILERKTDGGKKSTSSTKTKKKTSMVDGAADVAKIEGSGGVKLRELKSASGGKKGKSVEIDNQGKDKTVDKGEGVADLGKPSGRKKSKADIGNKGKSDVLSESDGSGVKKNGANSSSIEDDNGGEGNEAAKDGGNSSSRGRKKRNSDLKDNGGAKNEELKGNSNSAEKADGGNSARKKRNSNVKDDNGGGKIEIKEKSNAPEKVDGSNPSGSGGKKRKSNVKDENTKKSKSAEKKVDGSDPSSRVRKTRKSNAKDDNSVGVNEEIKENSGKKKELLREESFSRERKKSKYLSPPYTNINKGHSKKEIEAWLGGDKSTVGSPRIQSSAEHESDSLGPQTRSQRQTIDPSLVKAPADEVLSRIRSAALNPQETNAVDSAGQFFSAFRSSTYRNETNGENPSGKKRKLEKSELKSSEKEQKKPRKSEETKPNGENTGATLIVTFGPGSSLPSKNDLIKIYGKFGALNKKETEMFYTNYCAKVVFLKSDEAEEAFNVSQLSSPFGAANVTFRLRYVSEAKTRDLREISSHKPSASSKTPELQSSDNNLSELNFMKEKLEKITSLIETSEGRISPDVKSRLEGEVKVLLEKVSAMISSS